MWAVAMDDLPFSHKPAGLVTVAFLSAFGGTHFRLSSYLSSLFSCCFIEITWCFLSLIFLSNWSLQTDFRPPCNAPYRLLLINKGCSSSEVILSSHVMYRGHRIHGTESCLHVTMCTDFNSEQRWKKQGESCVKAFSLSLLKVHWSNLWQNTVFK